MALLKKSKMSELPHKKYSLILPTIDHKKIEDAYTNGTFVDTPIPKSVKIVNRKPFITITANNPIADTFVLKSRMHNGLGQITDNCSIFNYPNICDDRKKHRYRCNSCHRDFKTPGTGIYFEFSYDDNFEIESVLSYGNFCSDGCKLWFLNKRIEYGCTMRNWHLARIYLKNEYCMTHGKALTPSKDPLLLKINGGPYSDEEWESRDHNCVFTGSYVTQNPTKNIYTKIHY